MLCYTQTKACLFPNIETSWWIDSFLLWSVHVYTHTDTCNTCTCILLGSDDEGKMYLELEGI